ncbi:hypothetical protein FISHEDRAFT_63142 [Fistulina hepatica ATCC 64428]|uniref:BHLH domain-containing protein n=1 Tax=Fistulina hepatica ATCC 64428 TaxID=1128425 RepID=A0A0D7A1S4_9AGAR|nr:hypothetical protein FISHEDRAFT_63142 [Fistulina hepatica ATCC 64428]
MSVDQFNFMNPSVDQEPNALHLNLSDFSLADMHGPSNDFALSFPHLRAVDSSDLLSSGASFSPPSPTILVVASPVVEGGLAAHMHCLAGVMHAVPQNPYNETNNKFLGSHEVVPLATCATLPAVEAHPTTLPDTKPTTAFSPAPAQVSVSASTLAFWAAPAFTPVRTPTVTPTVTQASQSATHPKTSHNIHEQRYRANLNAQIVALRDTVPALHVVAEQIAYNPALKNIVVTNLAPLLDSHGYADGVKPPHKLSKANVLLKATEYITVLKRREACLERDLVGGPVLLSEWQREWELVWGNGEDKSEGIYDNPPAFLGREDSDGDDSSGKGVSTTRKKHAHIEVPAAPAKERPPLPLLLEVVLPDHTTVREKCKHGHPHKTPLPAPKAGLASPVVPVSAPAVNWPLFEQPSPLSVNQPTPTLEQALTAVLNSSGQSLQALTPQQLQALTLVLNSSGLQQLQSSPLQIQML